MFATYAPLFLWFLIDFWEIRKTPNEGTVLIVEGADILDGTPIYDVKPYLPFTDSHPDATAGFAGEVAENNLEVKIPDGIK